MSNSNSASDTTEEISAETPPRSTGMHRPAHGVLDTIETDCLDELQHEAAHRGSALRTPK